MYKAIVKTHFDAAHRLLNYDGECGLLHGHTWGIEVEIVSEKLNWLDISIDFRDVKKELKEIINRYDHSIMLNFEDPLLQKLETQKVYLFSGNPTAEIIAKEIYESLGKAVNGINSVTVWESPQCAIVYSR